MSHAPDPMEHAWWIASRSAGIVALVALSGSLLLGLLMANGLPRRRGAGRSLLAVHETSALAGLAAIGVHGVALLGDPWMHPTVTQIAVPFTISYEPLWTSAGIIGGWIAALLGLSFYLRSRIGPKRWRKAHQWTVLAWALCVAHTIGAGTDVREPWLAGLLAAFAVPVLFLFLRRVVHGDPKREAARRAATADA